MSPPTCPTVERLGRERLTDMVGADMDRDTGPTTAAVGRVTGMGMRRIGKVSGNNALIVSTDNTYNIYHCRDDRSVDGEGRPLHAHHHHRHHHRSSSSHRSHSSNRPRDREGYREKEGRPEKDDLR